MWRDDTPNNTAAAVVVIVSEVAGIIGEYAPISGVGVSVLPFAESH